MIWRMRFVIFSRSSGGMCAGLPVLVLAQVEVVIEAVLDGRPDGDLGLGVKLQHGLGHDMRGAVADLVELLSLSFLTLLFLCYSHCRTSAIAYCLLLIAYCLSGLLAAFPLIWSPSNKK